MKSSELFLVLGIGLSLFACDGGTKPATSGGSCPAFTPCGGAIVGTWHVKSMCIKNTPKDAACVVQSFGVNPGPGYNATYTFNANGTFTVSISGAMTETFDYPGVACSRTDASAAQYCAGIQQNIQSAFAIVADAGTMLPIKAMSCTCSPSSSEVCECEESVTYTPYTIDGTYTTSRDTITATAMGASYLGDAGIGDAGTGSPMSYCVSGNTLTLGPPPGSSEAGVIVLTK
jgi:hypothetical protein